MTKHYNTLLCLGDSYTIGESVPLHDSFPYQTVQLLRKSGLHFHAPEIVAVTGWTTFELANHLLHIQLNDHYDFVTLLIGVNNQYRGLQTSDFNEDFTFLLKKAIHLTHEKPERVIVLSIPDWGVTPFAAERDQKEISKEINAFNAICKELCEQHKVPFIDITESSRKAEYDINLLAKDQLHYSGKEHYNWAKEVAEVIKTYES